MKRIMSAAAVAFVLVCPAVHAAPAAQAQSNPMVEVAYLQARAANLQPVADRLKRRQVLEELKQFLLPLRLPRKLTVQFDQCGAMTRPYKAQGPATVCYELVEQIERIATKSNADTRDMVVAGTVVQAVFHELAEAIFDILGVPVWGRKEDAADRLAGFLMAQFGDEIAYQTIIGTAIFFADSGKTWTGSQFAAVDSPEAQRYYNYLCMAYGSDPKTFEYLAKAEKDKEPILPERRAARCKGEFEQVRKAFNLRIMPYVDPDLLIKVRATPWSLSTK